MKAYFTDTLFIDVIIYLNVTDTFYEQQYFYLNITREKNKRKDKYYVNKKIIP